jgi:hypothetical protein
MRSILNCCLAYHREIGREATAESFRARQAARAYHREIGREATAFTADWEAKGTRWTVPVGGGIGKIVRLGGKLPIKLEVGVFYSVVKPTNTGHWFLNTSLALIF